MYFKTLLFCAIAQYLSNASISSSKSEPAISHDHARGKRKVYDKNGMYNRNIDYRTIMRKHEEQLLKEERELFAKNTEAKKRAESQAKVEELERNKLIEKLAVKSRLVMENATAYVKAYIKQSQDKTV